MDSHQKALSNRQGRMALGPNTVRDGDKQLSYFILLLLNVLHCAFLLGFLVFQWSTLFACSRPSVASLIGSHKPFVSAREQYLRLMQKEDTIKSRGNFKQIRRYIYPFQDRHWNIHFKRKYHGCKHCVPL